MSIFKAIMKINPNAVFKYDNENIDSIVWLENTTPISKADIQAKITEVENEYNADQYKRDRASEYPSMADQLDDIFHNGIDGWKATIQAIKDKYPKE